MSKINESQKLKEELNSRYEYENIININNLVSKTDIYGNITYVNDEFCEITEYSKEELIGQNHRILKPEEANSDIYEPLWSAISKGKAYKGIVRNISKSGKEIYLSSTIFPIFNKEGTIIEYVAIRSNITNEITLKKELEIQNLKLKKAYELARIGTWEYNIKKRQTKLSQEILNTLCLEKHPNEVDINLINMFVHKNDIFEVTGFLQQVAIDEDKEHRCICRIILENGDMKWIDCQGKKVPNEDKIIGTLQDITERKEQQEEIRRKERIIIQQSKMATMGEMIANIAHQWRQPLSYITTASTGLKMKKEFGDMDDEIFNSSLEGINDSAQYLSKTIDDFRNFFNPNKIETNFDIKNTFDKTLKLINSQFYTNNIKIVSEIRSFKIYGYENELLQVFINIIKNAKDELINIKKERLLFIETLQYENEAIIKIKDNAGGIKKNNLDKIFNAYFTTKSSDEGTGIGLYMSKEIIERNMNGKIKVENETYSYEETIYKGALFTITIPLIIE